MISDTHVHTWWSSDSKADPEDQIKSAIAAGMKHIAITDHNDYDAPTFPPDYFNFLIDNKGDHDAISRYIADIERLKEKYSDRIEVLVGIEMGLQPHIIAKATETAEQFPFDFIIGSTHAFHRMDAEDKRHYIGVDIVKAIDQYFEEELKNLTLFHYYDTVGHFDFALRYGPGAAESFTYEAHQDVLDALLQEVIRSDKTIEINTSKYALKNMTNPNMAIVRRFAELGGKFVTFGSDSHVSSRIGEGFEAVAEMVKECGIKEYAVFHKHVPELMPIP